MKPGPQRWYKYNEAKHLGGEQLKPIAVVLDSLQADTATIVDAREQWSAILLHTHNVLEPHKAKITKRFNQAMTPTHYLTNMLHQSTVVEIYIRNI